MIRVFLLVKTDRQRQSLRRYREDGDRCTVSGYGCCNAHVEIEESLDEDARISFSSPEDAKSWDDRWPSQCACGYAFQDSDAWQLAGQSIYVRPDTGEEMTLKTAPVGACWDATWFSRRSHPLPRFNCGEDGRCLIVKTPGGDWMIDGRANNCTILSDTTHKCWVRHGSPEAGDLHVDKSGHTCAVGAGSIVLGSYHGFLHNGHLIAV